MAAMVCNNINMAYAHEHRATRPAPLPARVERQQNLPSKYFAPFDPEELTRRLYLVQAERAARDQRRSQNRAARSDAGADRRKKSHFLEDLSGAGAGQTTRVPKYRPERDERERRQRERHGGVIPLGPRPTDSDPSYPEQTPSASVYRHVPQVAATQFSHTTTVDSPEDKVLVHRLSRAGMKLHMQGPNVEHQQQQQPPHLQLQTQQRNRHFDPSQFQQHPPILGSTPLPSNQKLNRLSQTINTKDRRSEEMISSRGHMSSSSDIEDVASVAAAHRVDWTQSDENHCHPPRLTTSKTMPARLRKSDSRWHIKNRFGSGKSHDTRQNLSDETTPEDTPRSLRSPISGFFSRFKR